jgi:hypothetical protein
MPPPARRHTPFALRFHACVPLAIAVRLSAYQLRPLSKAEKSCLSSHTVFFPVATKDGKTLAFTACGKNKNMSNILSFDIIPRFPDLKHPPAQKNIILDNIVIISIQRNYVETDVFLYILCTGIYTCFRIINTD